MLIPDPFSILITQNSQCMQEIFLEIDILKRLPKIFKELALVFLPNPVPFNAQDYEKQESWN